MPVIVETEDLGICLAHSCFYCLFPSISFNLVFLYLFSPTGLGTRAATTAEITIVF